ncbi:ATP-binding cassette domain-containing protein [Duganella sp. sic0402]|uniref:ABC transporter ATP-binding protein n=1 Tax=Duganella sp. sic0402 TaxID=2854786 RepID=UPI001C43C5FA|nr:ATP-binding cassette domain-containing protein [Duganella sp. sic0402]MBV7536826.1 ATP-binding cassette domain-containing protein [Duganella sp. sic0402]
MSGKISAHLGVRNVSISAGTQVLVRDISLHIPAGGVLTLLGESGSGKSLLAQAIMGNLPAPLSCSGVIEIGGRQYDAADLRSRRALWGRTLSLLPQEPWLALDPTMRVVRQIGEVHELVLGRGETEASAAATAALARLDMADASAKYPFQISGGMAQRVAFLATHAAQAPILIIDEPTKGLDSDRRGDVLAMLKAAIADGVTLLTITHDVWLARQLGGEVAVMLDGAIVERGTATALLDAPQHAYTRCLLAAEPAAWAIETGHTPAHETPVVSIQGVGKRFGAQRLFDSVSAEIRRGELIAVTGPSGSGKTTFGNLVLGLLKTDNGSVHRAKGLARTAFQKIYQDPAAAFAPGVSLRRSMQDLIDLHQLAWEDLTLLLERLRLPPALLERLPGQVSGGELQRFAIARVLMMRPALIFADEPTSRLDPITQQETLLLLREHARRYQCAVLLVTHDHDIAAKLAQRQISL